LGNVRMRHWLPAITFESSDGHWIRLVGQIPSQSSQYFKLLLGKSRSVRVGFVVGTCSSCLPRVIWAWSPRSREWQRSSGPRCKRKLHRGEKSGVQELQNETAAFLLISKQALKRTRSVFLRAFQPAMSSSRRSGGRGRDFCRPAVDSKPIFLPDKDIWILNLLNSSNS
jgi:hypothetical protein